jgi:APA family basic amino acid/polyamine antiporter
MQTQTGESGPARPPELRLRDAVSLIVGITVGTAIFRSSTLVFQNTTGPWQALGVWLLGGVLCVFGGLCYAELATTYPRNGGDYEYLRRAYGRGVGFLYAWAQLAVVATGNIGAMAYAFADYSRQVWPQSAERAAWVAAGAILTLSLCNLLGLAVGRTLQNVLTSTKVVGLGGVVVAGLLLGGGAPPTAAGSASAPALMGPGIGLALVFVLYAFGGWSDAVFVAAEVRHQQRNLPRALLFGILGIAVIYLAVNGAYLAALGFDAARVTATPAADVLHRTVGPWGARLISLLVMVSALGAINGMILAHSRIYAAVGEDHRVFGFLGRRNRWRAPAVAIVTQAVISLAMVFGVGTATGRGFVDAALGAVGITGLPWGDYFGGFETLVAGSAPVFWAFFLLTGISVFVLRVRDRDRTRPFAVPLFPLPPIIFCAMCAYMLYSSLAYARWLGLLGALPLAAGLVLLAIDRTVLAAPRGQR